MTLPTNGNSFNCISLLKRRQDWGFSKTAGMSAASSDNRLFSLHPMEYSSVPGTPDHGIPGIMSVDWPTLMHGRISSLLSAGFRTLPAPTRFSSSLRSLSQAFQQWFLSSTYDLNLYQTNALPGRSTAGKPLSSCPYPEIQSSPYEILAP